MENRERKTLLVMSHIIIIHVLFSVSVSVSVSRSVAQ